MARAYSLDLRERVIAAVRSGQSRRKAAETFGVEPSTVVKWWLRYRATGEVAARPRGGSKVRALVDERGGVIMDNLGSHKGRAVRDAIRSVGAHRLLLPPYSPDLNPIEQAFAKLKALLRKASERTLEATWRRIGDLLTHFTPDECANYLAHAGYSSI